MPCEQRCMMSSSREEFPNLSRLEAWDSESASPRTVKLPSLQAATPRRTRSFSCTMCSARRSSSGVNWSLCSLNASTETSRKCVTVSPSFLRKAAAAEKHTARSSSYFPSTRACGAFVLANTNWAPTMGTTSWDTERQSIKMSEPARPIPELYWSKTPQPMPTKLFSAALAALTSVRSSKRPTLLGKRRASNLAVAISNAAELDTPAPAGTFETTKASKPTTCTSIFASSLTTPKI
mmetsp:Transcript_78688/g.227471  ORF Transcript_78688/g.227471 Transcript_78688/m.227471 type:complete len:236 (+) Transcript_78688:334-1041(+)